MRQASRSIGNAFVSGAGGLRFKPRAGRIGGSVANRSPPLQNFFEKSCVAAGAIMRRLHPLNSLVDKSSSG